MFAATRIVGNPRKTSARTRFWIVKPHEFQNISQHWNELGFKSVEDNVYYSRDYALALLGTTSVRDNIMLITAWEEGELIGLMPVARRWFPSSFPGWPASAWRTKYTFNCMPLLHRERSEIAAKLLLDGLASLDQGEWLLPLVNARGPACAALIGALNQRGAPWSFTNKFERASLQPSCSYEEYMRLHVPAKRRKAIERRCRRLRELGNVEFQSHTRGPGLERAVSSFLEVEASGWKGRRGTALACVPAGAAFARSAFAGGSGGSSSRADLLLLDGRAIAATLTVFAGRTGFSVKSCYDEEFRSFAPSLVLELEIIRSLLTEKWADRLDAATAGPHVIDDLWSGRTEVADLIFSLAPRHAQARLAAAERILAAGRRLKSAARDLMALARAPRRKAGEKLAAHAQEADP